MARTKPNIIITGTPGVGKSSHSELLKQSTDLEHLSINQVIDEHGYHIGYDEELKSHIVDEDKLLDAIEDQVKQGGQIIDWHICDIFPASWIDLVVVLRSDSTILYDRLKRRDYPERKLQENLDAEIMQVILEDARESYDGGVIIELQSDTTEDIDKNVERISEWINRWIQNNPNGV